MRQADSKIQSLIEPVINSMGFELVGLEFLSQGRHSLLRLYIDSEQGVTVDDCGRVSHQVSGVLDVEDPISSHYVLEVSSPGLDRPLFSIEHFRRFVGRQVKVRLAAPLEGRKKFVGQILEVNNGDVVLEVEGTRVVLNFAAIDKANLVPEF